MRRHTQFESGKQIPLALELMANPAAESALLAAYRRLELARRLSFEQVMSDRAYAIGVRNLADAILRRGTPRSATSPASPDSGQRADVESRLMRRGEFKSYGTNKGVR